MLGIKILSLGTLSRRFSIPPSTIKEHQEHIDYFKQCLQTGYMGEGRMKFPIDAIRQKNFEDEINNTDSSDYVEERSIFEKRLHYSQTLYTGEVHCHFAPYIF